MNRYKIVRFRFQGENEVIRRGLTLDQAQEHCNDESTHGGSTEDGTAWFDGYEMDEEYDDGVALADSFDGEYDTDVALVDEAHYVGDEGQDHESYTDDQDHESYVPDEDALRGDR